MAVHTVSHLAKKYEKKKKIQQTVSNNIKTQNLSSSIRPSVRTSIEEMDVRTDGFAIEFSFLAFEIQNVLWFFNLFHKYSYLHTYFHPFIAFY